MLALDLIKPDGLTVIYDGECPLCSRFADLAKLRAKLGRVDLVDAREHPGLSRTLLESGFDLDNGMIVVWKGQPYFGAAAVHFLALHASSNGPLEGAWKWLMSNNTVAGAAYPLLRAGRNAVLKMLRRKKINA